MTPYTDVAETEYPRLGAQQVGRTVFRQWHASTEPHIVDLLAALPDYVAARRGLKALLETEIEPVRVENAVDVLHDHIVAAALAGQPVPDDLVDQFHDLGAVPVYEGRHRSLGIAVAANATETLVGSLRGQAMDRARETVLNQLDGIIQRHGERILSLLGAKLCELVDEARKIAAGGRPGSAEQAIAESRVEEWTAIIELERQHAELRALHTYWLSQEGGSFASFGAGAPAQFVGFLANPLSVPDFSRLVTQREYRAVTDERAFQATGATTLPWPDSWLGASALWWFVAHPEAKPWTPSSARIDAAINKLSRAHIAHQRGARRTDDGTVTDIAEVKVHRTVVPSKV